MALKFAVDPEKLVVHKGDPLLKRVIPLMPREAFPVPESVMVRLVTVIGEGPGLVKRI